MFEGFSEKTGAFLWELSFNNERPWFLEHKEEFEREVNTPMKALAQQTLEELQKRCPERTLDVHVSRIYRDARRLYGRGPYKDHLWLVIYEGDRRAMGPAFWFELSPAVYSYGLGFWEPGTAVMESYRRLIDANPARFERLIRALGRKGSWQLWGEEYKRPKADRGALINPWYNRRYVSVGVEKDLGGDAFSPELPRLLAERYEALLPLHDFLWEAFRNAGAAG